jgi:hypothetical protein
MHSALQFLHVEDPVTLAYVEPSAQEVHAVAPVEKAAVPTAHGVQVLVPAPDAIVPLSQGRHCSKPSLSAYLPGVHRAQLDDEEMLEAVPVLQRLHDVDAVDRLEYQPAGHAGHCATASPDALEAVPALQFTQDVLPDAGCVLPGWHWVQFSAPLAVE